MRRRRAMSEINVVPYIDVMLVLLIIFMVAAPSSIQARSTFRRWARSSTPPSRRSKFACAPTASSPSWTARVRRTSCA